MLGPSEQNLLFYFFRERAREGERGRETSMQERNIYHLQAPRPGAELP